MLSRTASDLYWMSRYLERAENLARMLDVSYSLSLMPQKGRGDGLEELAMPLLITGMLDDYRARHGRLHAKRMLQHFALEPENPGSIYNCLQAARVNAHAVRGRITTDMWENINATWLEMRVIATQDLSRYGISRFCEWVKERSHLFRGATYGTIMRSDAYRFIRLGTFLERADNTLRLLRRRSGVGATVLTAERVPIAVRSQGRSARRGLPQDSLGHPVLAWEARPRGDALVGAVLTATPLQPSRTGMFTPVAAGRLRRWPRHVRRAGRRPALLGTARRRTPCVAPARKRTPPFPSCAAAGSN